jgi:hypothetical protein
MATRTKSAAQKRAEADGRRTRAAAAAPTKPKRVTVGAARRAIEAQPLVGVNAAAAIMGIQRPNFRRYKDRLTAVPVEGRDDAYFREEVVKLAEEMAAERAARLAG